MAHLKFSSILLFVLFAIAGNGLVLADQGTSLHNLIKIHNPERYGMDSEPYCGLYSMYAAIKYHESNVNFEQLLKQYPPKTKEGSTAAEIISGLSLHGVNSAYSSLVDPWFLRDKSSLICHFRRSLETYHYDHWVFAVKDNGRYFIFDGGKPVYSLSESELLSYWDGTAVIPLNENRENGYWLQPSYANIFKSISLILIALAIIFITKKLPIFQNIKNNEPAKIAIYFISCTVIVSIIINATSPYGLIRNPTVRETLWNHLTETAPQNITSKEYNHYLSSQKQYLLVDSRLPESYKMGSLKNAVNIPYYLDESYLKNQLSNINKNVPILVFCQSSQCPYSDLLVKKLNSIGYQNLSVCRDGYVEMIKTEITNLPQRSTPHEH